MLAGIIAIMFFLAVAIAQLNTIIPNSVSNTLPPDNNYRVIILSNVTAISIDSFNETHNEGNIRFYYPVQNTLIGVPEELVIVINDTNYPFSIYDAETWEFNRARG